MIRRISFLISLLGLAALAALWANGQANGAESPNFDSISKKEIEMLLADTAKSNPKMIERLAGDPGLKKQQLENLKQLLAFARQAEREGFALSPANRQELENIRAEVTAVNYDKEINKDKGPMPAFGFITEKQIAAYWAEDVASAKRTHESEFNDFLNAKLSILRANDPAMSDRQISDEERAQARDLFAKIRIYEAEYRAKVKSGLLPKELVEKADLQVKLQQAQFLARLYSESLATKTKVSDDELTKYIAAHPELNTEAKKARAEAILKRVQAGEDFATLANEFSEDPGNRGADGKPQGGIYRNIPKGTMVAPFEEAALALQPGQVAPAIVESDFGYHIIKLERKGMSATNAQPVLTYDARHILISTTYKDPSDPTDRGKPIKEFVRTKIEAEKEKQIIDKIVADNHIQVPADFDVPKAAETDTVKSVKKKVPVRTRRRSKRHK